MSIDNLVEDELNFASPVREDEIVTMPYARLSGARKYWKPIILVAIIISLMGTCVHAYNLIVMKHRVSVGAFDLDKIKLPTVLRFAKKGEKIHLLGDDKPTEYEDGEIAYFDKEGGFNIDFNYRDAQRTAVQLETKNLYINVDGVFDITPEKVAQVLQETCDIIMKYCGGTLDIFGIEPASITS